jgi:hypothetical protein
MKMSQIKIHKGGTFSIFLFMYEKKGKCPKIKIHDDLPQGELLQREEKLRKTFFVFECGLTFP